MDLTIRTASYCRVSTDSDEQQTSLKTQVAYYTYLILKNPKYEFAGIYADDGITGTSAKSRKEFLRLIEDCKAGKIDLILTKSISRFARNTLDCLKYIKELKECGTDIYFEKENINTADDKSHFLVSVIGSLAQEESVSSGSAIRWGKNILAQRGIVNPGTVNYGYKYGKDNEWVVIIEEAEIVKRIYKKFLAGKSFGQIARELTKDKNAKSPAGNDAWSDRTIKAILTNEVYRGNFLYQKMYTKQTIDKIVIPNRGELPMYLIEDHHEAIVSSEDWERVQEIHAERLKVIEESIKFRQPKENGKNEAFSKKLYCGECGGVISYKRGKTRYKKEVNSWRCNTSDKSSDFEKCKAGFIKQEYVELNFMNMIMGIRGNHDFDEYLNNNISRLELTKEEEVEEIEIKSRIEILNNMIYEAVDVELNKNGQDSRKIDELTGEIVRLRNRLKEFEERREQIGNIKIEVDWLFNQYLQEEYDESKIINYIPFYEYMFNRLIEKGIIYGDGKIVFVFKSGIEWSIPLRYKEYLVESQRIRVEDNRTKRLESDEVKGLLEFCKKPRTRAEMLEFSSYTSMSGIERSVIKSLMEEGKLKRKRDENYRALQYLYYTVE